MGLHFERGVRGASLMFGRRESGPVFERDCKVGASLVLSPTWLDGKWVPTELPWVAVQENAVEVL